MEERIPFFQKYFLLHIGFFTKNLLLNNYDRFGEKNYEFFNGVQPYLYHSGTNKDGIMVYSFAVNPEENQPSGTCNFTKLNSKQLNIETIIPPITNNKYDYLFNINIYCVNYNILTIQSGMGSLLFS